MEPRDVFISHTEQDGLTARTLAAELRALHLTTWAYEEDGVAGISYLTQINAAIESCRAFVLLASPKSVNAHQVICEVEQAHEREKIIIPARVGMSHQQFIASNPILRMACGTAVTLAAEEGKLAEVAKRIASALSFSELRTEGTQKRPPDTKPVEAPLTATAVPADTPAASEHHKQPVVVAVRRPAAPPVERTELPGEASAAPLSLIPARLWPSIWIGVVGQTIWAGAVAFDLVRNLVLEKTFLGGDLPFSHVIAPGFPVVVIACGLGLSRLFVGLRRSLDASRIQSGPNLLLVVTAVFVVATHTFLATALLPDPISVNWILLPGLSRYFLVFNGVCLALVWNGLRVLRTDAPAHSSRSSPAQSF